MENYKSMISFTLLVLTLKSIKKRNFLHFQWIHSFHNKKYECFLLMAI